MKALWYLTATKLKNQLKSLIRKPARMIYVVFMLAMLGLVLWSGEQLGEIGTFRPMEELTAIAFAVYAIMFLLSVNAGFSRGGSLFNLSDVNLIFTAPIRSQTVLFHGLLQQMTTSLVVGFFLLFQYGTLRGNYGITVFQLVGLLVGYAISIFLGQVTAMVLYAMTSGRERRQRLCRVVIYGVAALFLGYWILCALREGTDQILALGAEAANGSVLRAFPVAGWLAMASSGPLEGSWGLTGAGLALCAVYLGVLLTVIFRGNPDYYEDVLKSAEVTQSAINAKKEGTMTQASPARVKVGRTGLGRGWGAGVFFWKHRLEDRRSKVLLLSANALIFAAVTIAFSFFFSEGGLLSSFLMATYLQVFTVLGGRFNWELTKPYIYLIPEPPMKKLLWALAGQIPTAFWEALVVFVPVGLILELTVVEIAACVVARMSFAMLFTSAGVAVDRLWGSVTSRMLVLVLLLLVTLGLALPGIAAAIAVRILFWEMGSAAVLAALSVCNVLMSLLALFLCRNMLQYAELNQQ